MAISVVPDQSLQQRQQALLRANEIRSRRAQFKRDLKAQRKTLTVALKRTPWWLESAKIFDLLLALPKIGRVKANKILLTHKISPSKTLGGLSERQRSALIAVLGGR